MTGLRLLMVAGFVLLTGCGGIERLPDVPKDLTLSKVQPYSLDTHQRSIHRFEPVSVNERVHELMLQPRIENLLVLYIDPEVEAEYRGIPKKVYAQEIFRRFNLTIPRTPLQGGAWTLGPNEEGTPKRAYQSLHLQHELDKEFLLPQIGAESIAGAIDRLSDHASALRGRTGLLLLLDWGQIDRSVIDAIARFRQRGEYGRGFEVVPEVNHWQSEAARTCVFAIGLGNAYSRTLLDQVDSCGVSVSADQIAQPRDMAHFVEEMLFIGPADSDGDGIFDYMDKCADTAEGRLIDQYGCLRFGGESS